MNIMRSDSHSRLLHILIEVLEKIRFTKLTLVQENQEFCVKDVFS